MKRPYVLATAIISVLFACSSPSDDSDDNDSASLEPLEVSNAPLALEELPNAFARASCGAFTRCSCAWDQLTGCTQDGVCFENESECVERFEQAGQLQFNGPADAYNSARARECINAVLTSSCDDAVWFDVCQTIFGGTVDDAAPTRAGLGEACNGTCIDSAARTFCSIDLSFSGPSGCSFDQGSFCDDSVCVALLEEGVACDDTLQCAPPLVCSGSACATPIEPGGACSPEPENPCTAGSYCSSGACVAQLALGEACIDDEECESGHCDQVCLLPGQMPVCQL